MAVLTEALKTSYDEVAKVLPSKQKIYKSAVYYNVHGVVVGQMLDEKELV